MNDVLRSSKAKGRLLLAGAAIVGLAALPRLYASPGTPDPTATPDFNHEVASILYNKCASCHRAGTVAPMSFTSYEEVRPWARSIKAKVVKHEMPPWSADPRFGTFMYDRSLTQAEIDTIVKWVDGGAPQGAGAAPELPKFDPDGWRTVDGRPPDVIVEMPMEYQIPAEGQIPIFRLWDKNPFNEDIYIQALQIRPSNPAVVHHSALYGRPMPEGTTLQKKVGWKNGPEIAYIPTYADGSIINILTAGGGGSESIEGVAGRAAIRAGDVVPVVHQNVTGAADSADTGDSRLMFYLPGTDFQQFPEGSAKLISKDNALMWEVHYTTDGKPETDRERIGLWLARTPTKHEVIVVRNGSGQHIIERKEVGNVRNIPNIPPNTANWRITAIQPFTEDATLSSMQPHMHQRGHDMTFIATYPDGHEEILLSVPSYDFNWQNTYMPEKPVHLPAGSTLKSVGHYDNSIGNRSNPQPNRPVFWSEQTWDEMFNGFVELTYDNDATVRHDTRGPRTQGRAQGDQVQAVPVAQKTSSQASKNPITTVVGCALPTSSPEIWRLAQAARLGPAASTTRGRGRNARESWDIASAESERAAKLDPGKDAYELIGVADFVTPEQALNISTRKALYTLDEVNSTGALQAGHKVAAKGVLVPGETPRINLTSVVDLGQSCQAVAAPVAQ
jgi:5-deoxy-D-glucuronate isomerase/mono/diheme cytochrome c family protein